MLISFHVLNWSISFHVLDWSHERGGKAKCYLPPHQADSSYAARAQADVSGVSSASRGRVLLQVWARVHRVCAHVQSVRHLLAQLHAACMLSVSTEVRARRHAQGGGPEWQSLELHSRHALCSKSAPSRWELHSSRILTRPICTHSVSACTSTRRAWRRHVLSANYHKIPRGVKKSMHAIFNGTFRAD